MGEGLTDGQFLQSAAEDEVASVYGENWPRLQRLKQKIDPANMFRNCGWPRPGAEADSAASAFVNGQPHADGIPNGTPPGKHPELPSEPTADSSHPVEEFSFKRDKGKGRAVEDGQGDIFERLASLDQSGTVRRGEKAEDANVAPMTGVTEAAEDIPVDQRQAATVGAPVPGE